MGSLQTGLPKGSSPFLNNGRRERMRVHFVPRICFQKLRCRPRSNLQISASLLFGRVVTGSGAKSATLCEDLGDNDVAKNAATLACSEYAPILEDRGGNAIKVSLICGLESKMCSCTLVVSNFANECDGT